MTIKKYRELNDMQLDALAEIGNIGSGNAATALSDILDHTVNMDVPKVSVMGYEDVMSLMGGPEEIVSAVLVELGKDFRGMMLFVQRQDFIGSILNSLLEEEITSFEEMTEMDASAVMEIGNILMSSYIRAIADFTGLEIDISVPSHTVNMAGAILSVPIVNMAEETDELLMIQGHFVIDDERISSNLIMIPYMESLNRLLDGLGVGTE